MTVKSEVNIMTKRVLRDYFAAFRWQKIKESQKISAWWAGIYFLTLCPAILQVYNSLTTTLLYYLIGIPFVFAMYVPTIHTMRLPKIMYLCPLNTEQRREYIIKACAVRITVSLIVDIASMIILLACGICDGVMAISIFMNHALISVAIGSGINQKGFGKITEKGDRVINPNNKKEYLEMWICLVAFLTCMAHYSMVYDLTPTLLIRIIAVGIPLVILLPPTIAYLQFWKQAVAETMTYER